MDEDCFLRSRGLFACARVRACLWRVSDCCQGDRVEVLGERVRGPRPVTDADVKALEKKYGSIIKVVWWRGESAGLAVSGPSRSRAIRSSLSSAACLPGCRVLAALARWRRGLFRVSRALPLSGSRRALPVLVASQI